MPVAALHPVVEASVMVAMLSSSVSSSTRPDRSRVTWGRSQVRLLVLLAALFAVHVTASALYVLGG